jgi:hypothetical protein
MLRFKMTPYAPEQNPPSSDQQQKGIQKRTWFAIVTAILIPVTAIVVPILVSRANSAGPSASPLSVESPGEAIPRCALIRGQGAAPKGKVVWLASQGEDDSTLYFREAQVNPDNPNKWQIRGDIGNDKDGGFDFIIRALLIDEGLSDFLHRISAPEGLASTVLPPHSAISAPVTMKRDKVNNDPC